MLRSGAKLVTEKGDSLPQDIHGTSPPATMDIGDDLLHWVNEKDCLAIGNLDQEPHSAKPRYEYISWRGKENRVTHRRSGKALLVHHMNGIAVGLITGRQLLHPDGAFHSKQIFSHRFRSIAVVPSCVKGGIGLMANAAVAGEHAMRQVWDHGEMVKGMPEGLFELS